MKLNDNIVGRNPLRHKRLFSWSLNGYRLFRHSKTGATGVAHIDRVDQDQLEDLLENLFAVSGKIQPQSNFLSKVELVNLELASACHE